MFIDATDPTVPPGAPPDVQAGRGGGWEVRDLVSALVIIVAAFLLTVSVLVLAGEVGLADTEGTDEPALIATLFFEAMFGLGVLALARRRGLGWRDLGFVRPRRWGPLLAAWIGAYIVLVGYQAAVRVLEATGLDVSLLEADNAIPGGDERGAVLLVLLGVAVLVMAPLAEELYFRALWYRGLRRFLGVGPALALSGLLFGAFHLNLGVLIPFSLVGVLLAWANEESGSLWTSIGAHAGFNGISYALTVAGVEG